MKSLLSCSLVLSTVCSLFAQSYVIMVKPAGQKLWGYANLKGEMIIPAQFEKCYPFADGVAPINDKEWYFINIKGEKIKADITDFRPRVAPMGFDIFNFTDGLFPVKQGDKWGYLNTSGKLVIPVKYDEITQFDGGFATVKLGKEYIVLNTKGQETTITDADIKTVKEFSEHLAPYQNTGKKFGYIGSNGKIVIKAQFESVGYFHNGLAWAKTSDDKLGYIDTKGEWVIKPQFDIGFPFDKESGIARVKTGDKWFFVNKAGEPMYVNDTEKYHNFANGLSLGERNKKTGFFDNKAKWVIAPELDGAREFQNDYAAAKRGEKWGVIDKKGKWVMEPIFDGIRDVEIVK